MKSLSPILTALMITSLIGLGILLVGANALSNKNSVPVSNSPASASAITSSSISSNSSGDPSQVAQLQNLVSQYQTQLKNETQQLNEAIAQLKQYQSLLLELQRRGIITIGNDGTIYIPSGIFR